MKKRAQSKKSKHLFPTALSEDSPTIAREATARENRRLNVARTAITRLLAIAARSGVSRDELREVLEGAMSTISFETASPPAEEAATYFAASEVMSAWIVGGEHSDEYGEPAVLPFRGKKSLSQLAQGVVQRYKRTVSARAVIDLLQRRRVIVKDGARWRLISKALLTTEAEPYPLAILECHISTVYKNIAGCPTGGRRLFDRAVFCAGLSPERLPEFAREVQLKQEPFLAESDRYLSLHGKKTGSPDSPFTMGAGVGVFVWEESDDPLRDRDPTRPASSSA